MTDDDETSDDTPPEEDVVGDDESSDDDSISTRGMDAWVIGQSLFKHIIDKKTKECYYVEYSPDGKVSRVPTLVCRSDPSVDRQYLTILQSYRRDIKSSR